MKRALTCLSALLLVLTATVPAVADQGAVTTTYLATATSFNPGVVTPIVTTSLTLAAGESRHVRGRLEATSTTTATVAMDNIVKCLSSSGAQVGVAAISSRNHEGSDATNYAIDGHLPIYADLLFTAPTAGTYTCGLYGWTDSSGSTSYHLTAVATSTWLAVSATNQAGAHWWQNPACASNGTSATCTYLGAGTSSTYVFYSDGTPVYKWTPSATATAVDAQANIELTTCYTGTASCDSRVSGYQMARGTNAVVDVRMEVIQLDATAHTCVNNATATQRITISDEAHHYIAYAAKSLIPISSTCGSRQFILRVYVAYVSGNPIKVDGVQGTNSLTNGMLMDRS